MSDQPSSPHQEAISLIGIVSILISILLFVACQHDVPVIFPVMQWVAGVVYHLLPSLGSLNFPNAAMLISCASVGVLFWICTMPLAGWLSGAFSQAQLGALERQTQRLQRNRKRIRQKRRDRDGFNVR